MIPGGVAAGNSFVFDTTILYDATGLAPNTPVSFVPGPLMTMGGLHSHCGVRLSSVEFAIIGGVNELSAISNGFHVYNFDDGVWNAMPGLSI